MWKKQNKDKKHFKEILHLHPLLMQQNINLSKTDQDIDL